MTRPAVSSPTRVCGSRPPERHRPNPAGTESWHVTLNVTGTHMLAASHDSGGTAMWIRRLLAIIAVVSALVLLIAGAASAATAIEYGLLAVPVAIIR